MTNPITIITQDHHEVRNLFKKYKSLGDNAFKAKQALAQEIIRALSIHTEMEETLFYPKLEKIFNKKNDRMVAEAYTEHGVIKKLLNDMTFSKIEKPEFDANMKVLIEIVSHHVEEEEGELLPQAEKELSNEQLETIGREMKEFKIKKAANGGNN